MDTFSSSHVGTADNTTHPAHLASLADYPEYRASLFIWKVLPPCLLLLGGFGNIATVCVMRRIKDHNSSQHAFLMALAISDLTLLCATSIKGWIPVLFNVNVQVVHVVICKVVMWVIYCSNVTSAWLVTCVTAQRAMAVLWPHRMRVMCTVRRTWIVIAIVVLAVLVFYFHLMMGRDIIDENTCGVAPSAYKEFYDFVFPWMDLCVASFIPSVCLFVCDIVLSVTLYKSLSSSSIAASVDSNTDARRKTSSRTTVLVLTLSCTFFVLTTPECVYLIWDPYLTEEVRQNPKTMAMVHLLHAIAHQLWCTNSAINFLLYCLTGTKFRREFINWIHCGAQKSSASADTASEASKRRKTQAQ